MLTTKHETPTAWLASRYVVIGKVFIFGALSNGANSGTVPLINRSRSRLFTWRAETANKHIVKHMV
jgi:hypothetical protein